MKQPRSAAPRIVHVPDYADLYQRALLGAQIDLGIPAEYAAHRRVGVDVTLLAAGLYPRRAAILHLHWQHPFLLAKSRVGTILHALNSLLQIVVLRFLGVRLVWTVHNLESHGREHPRIERWATRWLARTVHLIIVHCPQAEGTVRAAFRPPARAPIRTIPHAIFPAADASAAEVEEARRILDIPPAGLLFLNLGIIRDYKGLDELATSFRTLEAPDVRLLIAGHPASPALTRRLEEAARADPRIQLDLRIIPQEETRRLFIAADVAVYPYRDILTSGGILSAAAHSLPVIAPRLGCISAQVPTAYPWLYDPRDAAALEKVLRLASEAAPPYRRRLGKELRDHAALWDWPRAARATAEAYRQVGVNPYLSL